MTNTEILNIEKALYGIEEEVDTFQGWKAKGYSVKKGSKALFKTKIWKPRKQREQEQTDEQIAEIPSKFIMVNAFYFGRSQVERTEVA